MSSMADYMIFQTVRDKIASTMKSLGLSNNTYADEIQEGTFLDIKLITAAYAQAVIEGHSKDIVTEHNREEYTTLHYLMDIAIIQSIRLHAAKHGVITELVLTFPGEDDLNET